MYRVTQDVMELRHWAEARGAQPCRDAESGRIAFAFGGEPCAVPVGWDEFEPAFCATRCVFVYDDAPGSRRHFLGSEPEAQAFVCGGDAPARA